MNSRSILKNFSCISCKSVFSAYSTFQTDSEEKIKIGSCSNCNSFYIGSSSGTRVGKVESFYKKEEKANKKTKKVEENK